MPPATLHDVARATGLAVSSVADMLRGRPGYSEKTRQRVMEAARELDFVPNHVAKSLVSRKSKTIGIAARLNNAAITAPMLRAMSESLAAAGYMPLIMGPPPGTDGWRTAIRELRNRQVDGVIHYGDVPPEELSSVVPESFPLVVIRGTPCNDPRSVVLDPHQAFRTGVHWLAERGHRRIAFVGCENARVMNSPYNSHRLKIEGYLQGMREISLQVPTLLIDGPSDPTELLRFLREQPVMQQATAVLAANDRIAVTVMGALTQLGRSVPADCSVIGFDATDFAQAVTPRLTTFDPRMDEVGTNAVALMMKLLQGQATQTIEIVPRLIERDSTQERR